MEDMKKTDMTVLLSKDEFSSLMFLTGWGGEYYLANNIEVEHYLKNFLSKEEYNKFRKDEPEFVTFKRQC